MAEEMLDKILIETIIEEIEQIISTRECLE